MLCSKATHKLPIWHVTTPQPPTPPGDVVVKVYQWNANACHSRVTVWARDSLSWTQPAGCLLCVLSPMKPTEEAEAMGVRQETEQAVEIPFPHSACLVVLDAQGPAEAHIKGAAAVLIILTPLGLSICLTVPLSLHLHLVSIYIPVCVPPRSNFFKKKKRRNSESLGNHTAAGCIASAA